MTLNLSRHRIAAMALVLTAVCVWNAAAAGSHEAAAQHLLEYLLKNNGKKGDNAEGTKLVKKFMEQKYPEAFGFRDVMYLHPQFQGNEGIIVFNGRNAKGTLPTHAVKIVKPGMLSHSKDKMEYLAQHPNIACGEFIDNPLHKEETFGIHGLSTMSKFMVSRKTKNKKCKLEKDATVFDAMDFSIYTEKYYEFGDLVLGYPQLKNFGGKKVPKSWNEIMSENIFVVRQCFKQMLEALKYAHANDIIHCDMKGANIFGSLADQDIQAGDRVSHRKFAHGIVDRIEDGNAIVLYSKRDGSRQKGKVAKQELTLVNPKYSFGLADWTMSQNANGYVICGTHMTNSPQWYKYRRDGGANTVCKDKEGGIHNDIYGLGVTMFQCLDVADEYFTESISSHINFLHKRYDSRDIRRGVRSIGNKAIRNAKRGHYSDHWIWGEEASLWYAVEDLLRKMTSEKPEITTAEKALEHAFFTGELKEFTEWN